MNPRARAGGVCSVVKTPYRRHSASTSSRYLYDGLSANSALDRGERRIEFQNLSRLLERLREGRGPIDLPSDDRLDDLRELRRMRRREKDPLRSFDAEIADGGMRIEQIPGAIVHVFDRRLHFDVVVHAAGDVPADGFEVAAIQPQHPLEVARVADVHGVRDRMQRRAGLERPA